MAASCSRALCGNALASVSDRSTVRSDPAAPRTYRGVSGRGDGRDTLAPLPRGPSSITAGGWARTHMGQPPGPGK